MNYTINDFCDKERNKEIQDEGLLNRRKYAALFVEKKRKELNLHEPVPAIAPSSLNNVELSDKALAKLIAETNPIAISVLCGTVFGDARLIISALYDDEIKSYVQVKNPARKTEANASFIFKHTTRQADWFFWKAFCGLAYFKVIDSAVVFIRPEGYQKKSPVLPGEILGKWQVKSPTNAKITKLFEILYFKKKKKLKRTWLNHMNNYFLMTLWLDDGSLYNQNQGVICLNSTAQEELEILRDYLSQVWGVLRNVMIVPSKATKSNPKPFQLHFLNIENTKKFLKIIVPIIPVKSMLYKVCFFDRDPADRQRWTAYLKDTVRKEWHDHIDEYYIGLAASVTYRDGKAEDIVQLHLTS